MLKTLDNTTTFQLRLGYLLWIQQLFLLEGQHTTLCTTISILIRSDIGILNIQHQPCYMNTKRTTDTDVLLLH